LGLVPMIGLKHLMLNQLILVLLRTAHQLCAVLLALLR
jgi:hypothetical protein